jgi:lipoprotein-releasing system permease protein
VSVLPQLRTIVFVAVRQLWQRKLLNGIAVGGVTLGVLVLIAMNGIMLGFQEKFTSTILRISPHITLFDTELRPRPPVLERRLGPLSAIHVAHESPSKRQSAIKRPYEIVRALRGLDEVDAVAPSVAGTVLLELGGKTKSVDLRGIDVAAQDRVTSINQYVKAGRLRDLDVSGDAIAVGSGIADDLGLHVGDTVRAASPAGKPLDLKVVAIFEAEVPPVDRTRGYSTVRVAQTLLGREDAITRIEVRLKDPERAVRVNTRFERMFGYDGESWQEANANFLSIFAMQTMVVRFVIGAILLVGGFGILAIQVMIVLQKQRDIAILRSVGLRRLDILYIFFVQGVTIALVGGVLGDTLGKIAVHYLGLLPVRMEGLVKSDTFLVHEDPAIYVWGILFALVVGVVASFVPALRGSRVEPVEVLRGQIG